jgi:hypothetical protein
MKTDDELCKRIWSALANVDWYKPETHDSASYSFRAAGDMIAAIIGRGNYMDWYCSGPYAAITNEIRRSFHKAGWIADTQHPVCDETGCLDNASCGWWKMEKGHATLATSTVANMFRRLTRVVVFWRTKTLRTFPAFKRTARKNAPCPKRRQTTRIRWRSRNGPSASNRNDRLHRNSAGLPTRNAPTYDEDLETARQGSYGL